MFKCSSTLPDKPWGLSDFQIPPRQICSPHNSQVKREWRPTWLCTSQVPFPKGVAGLSWLWTLCEGRSFPLTCGGEHSLGWHSCLHPQFTFLRNHMKDTGTAESLLNVLKKTFIEDSKTKTWWWVWMIMNSHINTSPWNFLSPWAPKAEELFSIMRVIEKLMCG